MASVRLAVRVLVVPILLASLVLMGSGVMAIGAASASPSSCYPPGSTSCPGKLTAVPSTVLRGGTVTVSGTGFNAGAKVSINVCKVGTVTTIASDVGITGQITVLVTMPVKAPLGSCKLTATGFGANGQTLTLTVTVTVIQLGSKTALKLSKSKVSYGDEQVELLSVTVSPLSSRATLTGQVTVGEFKLPVHRIHGKLPRPSTLCVITLKKGKGSCRMSAKNLGTGTYDLVATYGGNPVFSPSTSSMETLTVKS